MINESTRQKLIEKILNSHEFCSSTIYGNYLTYLVESSIQKKNLKETTIAIEVFGKDANFNPAEDTIVRSHTYTLRKKLEHYYFTEGKDDKYRLKIPKGHYEVQFEQVSDSIYSAKYILHLFRNSYQLFFIAILVIALIVIWLNYRSIKNQLAEYNLHDKKDPIWTEYLQSELPILLIPGDHMILEMYIKEFDRVISIRDVLINSEDDLNSFRAQHPEYIVNRAPEPYFPYHSIWSIPPILTMLNSANKRPIFRKSSDVNPQLLDEYNIVFLGSIKTLYTLRHTLAISNFDFEISPHRIIYSPPDSSESKIFSTNLHSSGPNEDLVIALKLPGPKNNAIFIIASYHSLGAPEIANYFVNPERRQELEKLFSQDYQEIPKYFEVLFRVTGIDKTAYRTEILVYNRIN